MPYYTISVVDERNGETSFEVIEAVDLEMAGEILAARRMRIVEVTNVSESDPRTPKRTQQQAQQSVVIEQQKSVFGGVVMALLFVFIGIPIILFIAVPLSIFVLAWIVSLF